MTYSQRVRLESAVAEVTSWGAVLDVMQGHMVDNAKASLGLLPPVEPGYRVYVMSPGEARAFDFVLTMTCAAAEHLRAVYDEASAGKQ